MTTLKRITILSTIGVIALSGCGSGPSETMKANDKRQQQRTAKLDTKEEALETALAGRFREAAVTAGDDSWLPMDVNAEFDPNGVDFTVALLVQAGAKIKYEGELSPDGSRYEASVTQATSVSGEDVPLGSFRPPISGFIE